MASLAALAVAAGLSLGAHDIASSSVFHEYFLIPKPANIYESQSAFAQLQRETLQIQIESNDPPIASYFQVAMIRQDVPYESMHKLAGEISKLYRHEVSQSAAQMRSEGAINRAAGLNTTNLPAAAAVQNLYGGTLGLINLQSATSNLQLVTNQNIADSYYTKMIYYGINDKDGAIAYFIYALATNQNAPHNGMSAQQEIATNHAITAKAMQNLMLLYASGAGLGQIKYDYTSSASSMSDATQVAVDWARKKNRIIIPGLLATPLMGAGSLIAISLAMHIRRALRDMKEHDAWPEE